VPNSGPTRRNTAIGVSRVFNLVGGRPTFGAPPLVGSGSAISRRACCTPSTRVSKPRTTCAQDRHR
jgi:hypothetical protein